MVIEEKKVVSITYKLKEDNAEGDVVQEVKSDQPFVFLFGVGQLLPKFEENLQGKKVGDNFEFGVPSDDAYGPVEKEAIVDLPKDIFLVDGKLADFVIVGNYVPMQDNKGNQMQGMVLEIGDETIKIDFNHPMAGRDLHFTGEVLEVREATSDELDHGHAHGPGGHQH